MVYLCNCYWSNISYFIDLESDTSLLESFGLIVEAFFNRVLSVLNQSLRGERIKNDEGEFWLFSFGLYKGFG